MLKRLARCRDLYNQKVGELKKLENILGKTEKEAVFIRKELIRTEKAQIIIQVVSQQIQSQIKIHIEDIVTDALDAIFPRRFEFKIDFVTKRNKTECEMYLQVGEDRMSPVGSNGGGVVDIASFALRIALWNLQTGKKNNTIILDEPVKFVSKELLGEVGLLIKKISEKLNIQFLLVTHILELIENSDAVWQVMNKKGVSVVKRAK